jgi:predicted metal-binding membrane protein
VCIVHAYDAAIGAAAGEPDVSRHMTSERASGATFFAAAALVFVASAAATIAWCGSMPGMGGMAGGMAMPGGWTMSMAWMRMPGQSWLGAAAMFLAMWVVMMVAMMLPSLAPMLWRYRQAVSGASEGRSAWLIALAGLSYFFVWTLVGAAVFPLGASLAALEMQMPALAEAVPLAAGFVVLIAGLLQFTAWKAHHLSCCRGSLTLAPGSGSGSSPRLAADAGTAWRYGISLGLYCSICCAGLTTILLVIGVMDLRAMAVVAAAITLERLAPTAARTAQGIGIVAIGAGLVLLARAAGLG